MSSVISIDRERLIGAIDPKLFGGFLEHMGRAIYEGKGTCYLCHGEDGEGYGPEAAGLDPPPTNLTDATFQAARTDGELMWVLRHGIANTNMPAFVGKGLTEEEGWAVIHYIRSLKR